MSLFFKWAAALEKKFKFIFCVLRATNNFFHNVKSIDSQHTVCSVLYTAQNKSVLLFFGLNKNESLIIFSALVDVVQLFLEFVFGILSYTTLMFASVLQKSRYEELNKNKHQDT